MSSKEVEAGSRRARFTPEFKADAVAMVIDTDRTIVDVAQALGLVEQTLGNWVRQARIDRGECAGLTSEDRSELVRLRRESPGSVARSGWKAVIRTLVGMEIACAECGCLVDRGVRVIPCENPECCCRDLPIGEVGDSGERD